MSQKKHNWLLYAIITMLTWGVWMTFSDPTLGDKYLGIPSNFPSEMVYVIWVCCGVPLLKVNGLYLKPAINPR